MTKFLSSQDVARQIGIDPATFSKWKKQGITPPAVRLGKRDRYRVEDVEEWYQNLHRTSRYSA